MKVTPKPPPKVDIEAVRATRPMYVSLTRNPEDMIAVAGGDWILFFSDGRVQVFTDETFRKHYEPA